MIKVSKGLTEGEVVMLTPPLKAATVEQREKGESASGDAMMNKIDEKLKAANGNKGKSDAAQEILGKAQPEKLNRSTKATTAKGGQERPDGTGNREDKDQDDGQGQNRNTEQKGKQ